LKNNIGDGTGFPLDNLASNSFQSLGYGRDVREVLESDLLLIDADEVLLITEELFMYL
jgi:hypothetical protein